MKWPIPSWYFRREYCTSGLQTGYIILDYIQPADGVMLSNTWFEHRLDPRRRDNLFRGLAKILVTLARVPAPRIGSFRFHDDGTFSLTNRPLSCSLIIQENEGAKRLIQPDRTYSVVE